jgi:hypothetical protein
MKSRSNPGLPVTSWSPAGARRVDPKMCEISNNRDWSCAAAGLQKEGRKGGRKEEEANLELNTVQ